MNDLTLSCHREIHTAGGFWVQCKKVVVRVSLENVNTHIWQSAPRRFKVGTTKDELFHTLSLSCSH